MDAARGAAESRDPRFDELYAEAKSTLGYGANSLPLRDGAIPRAYRDSLARWHRLRTSSMRRSRPVPRARMRRGNPRLRPAPRTPQRTMRTDVERQTGDLGKHQQELSKLELSVRSMENAWLFLERVTPASSPKSPIRVCRRTSRCALWQAQEAERSRLARKSTTDPPRLSPTPSSRSNTSSGCSTRTPRPAHNELRFLRELLRREAGRGPNLHQPAPPAAPG